jgi:hypothetical protein
VMPAASAGCWPSVWALGCLDAATGQRARDTKAPSAVLVCMMCCYIKEEAVAVNWHCSCSRCSLWRL